MASMGLWVGEQIHFTKETINKLVLRDQDNSIILMHKLGLPGRLTITFKTVTCSVYIIEDVDGIKRQSFQQCCSVRVHVKRQAHLTAPHMIGPDDHLGPLGQAR